MIFIIYYDLSNFSWNKKTKPSLKTTYNVLGR